MTASTEARLPAWLDVAVPRREVADGSFDESVFAADLGLVDRGRGPADYLDPVAFCEKTYPTENLRAVLLELAARLTGDPAAAGIYRLQTEFGGGKTHTLLAAYHVFREPSKVALTPFVSELAVAAGRELPEARVVVLDGSAIVAGAPEEIEEGLQIYSLLGQLAYRLGGADAYAGVAEQDRSLLGSGTSQLATLLEAHTPCLVLLDETLEYLNKALSVSVGEGNLAGNTLTFIKELCTAASNVPGAAVLATLTSSRREDYATVAGVEMQERLSMVVGRTENIVTPVEGDDIFPILHRRLFSELGAEETRRAVATAFANHYETLGDAVAATYREVSYRDRLASAYPFHPELVDILTNRWGSLSGFQRTRGALRTLAHTVKSLAQRRHSGALILPGDVELGDAGIRAEVLRFAGESYKAALNSDIIRGDSKAAVEDQRRGGQAKELRLATSLATTAFLNSFGSDKVLGASTAQMLLGVSRPGLSRGLVDDVRDALQSSAWYLRLEGGRYRFTTEPTLNKVVMEREGAIGEERVIAALREALGKVATGPGPIKVYERVEGSADLPDQQELTLGVLGFDLRISGDGTDAVLNHATETLENRGTTARVNKNAVMLLAADDAALTKARASARTLAALREVKADGLRLSRFNKEQREQLEERLAATDERVPQQVAMAYRHLIMLGQDGAGLRPELIDLGPARVDARLAERVLEYLRSADRIAETTLAPAALLAERFGLLPRDRSAVELDALLGAFAKYPRLPKLANPQVLRAALVQGVAQGLFGLSSGSAWDAPDAVLRFREPVARDEIEFQPGTFLVRAKAMESLLGERGQADGPERSTPGATHPDEEEPGTAESGGTEPDGQRTALRLTIDLAGIPSSKTREVLRAAVLPLAASNPTVTIDLTIHVDGGQSGVSLADLDLTVLEGLRQLGLEPTVRHLE